MKNFELAVVLTLCCYNVNLCSGGDIPDYIKPCSKSAPDFKKCCVDRGNEALPTIIKGDKKFKIPNMLPITFPKVDVDAGQNLKVTFYDVSLFGLDTVKVTDFSIDFDKKMISLKIHADKASLVGQYDISGKIMILPVTGKGASNITITDSKFQYDVPYTLVQRNGKEYANLQKDDHINQDIGTTYFKFDNLFNGNKQMGDNVNNFLNENQKDVIKELSGAITSVVSAVARNIGGAILGNVPFNELFLP